MYCSRLQKVVRSSQILLLAVPFVMGDGVVMGVCYGRSFSVALALTISYLQFLTVVVLASELDL